FIHFSLSSLYLFHHYEDFCRREFIIHYEISLYPSRMWSQRGVGDCAETTANSDVSPITLLVRWTANQQPASATS
ncbi:hypothetical protein PMAYCL1PPCAC_29586, partial [Pristionchus mayeri]